jgi:hypothetical protein
MRLVSPHVSFAAPTKLLPMISSFHTHQVTNFPLHLWKQPLAFDCPFIAKRQALEFTKPFCPTWFFI